MQIDWVRRYCMSMPHATESVQWGADLVFKIGGKMFAVLVLEPAKVWVSFEDSRKTGRPTPLESAEFLSCTAARKGAPLCAFKCSPEEFAELVERPSVIPAPYSARYYWVALETEDALSPAELQRLLRRSYELVLEKLPKKTRSTLS